MKKNEDENYVYCCGDRVRYVKSTGLFQVVNTRDGVVYQIYPSEFTEMIEIASKNGQFEFLLFMKDVEKHDNQGALKMFPETKWI